MLYFLLQSLARFSSKFFYRRQYTKNAKTLPRSGPALVVSNHPNTLSDPIAVALSLPRPLLFLANASLFATPFASKVMYTIFTIPIYRKQDVKMLGVKPNNDAVFMRCFEKLEDDSQIMIFPEGTSFIGRTLREIKTGAARIALGAEARNNYELGLQIPIIGLNYTDPIRFGGDLFINIGEPVRAADFAELHREKPRKAVLALTKKIEESLNKLVINCRDEEEDLLLEKCENLFRKTVLEKIPADLHETERNFLAARSILSDLQRAEMEHPEGFARFKDDIRRFYEAIKALKIGPGLLDEKEDSVRRKTRLALPELLLGAPVFLLGWLINILPYSLPGPIAEKITSEKEFWGSIKMLAGTFIFIGWFFGWALIFRQLNVDLSLIIAWVIAAPSAGFYALRYARIFGRTRERMRILSPKNKARKTEAKELLKKLKTYPFFGE